MTHKNYIEDIEAFIPECEQEISDQKIMLELIKKYPETILTRQNKAAHLTSSGFILNKTGDQCLMIYHNIYNSWSWTGGHADGESDLLSVASREAFEETGITNLIPLSAHIASLDILPVIGHMKHKKYVSTHLHLSVSYLFIGDESKPLLIKPDENSAVSWLKTNRLNRYCSEEHMLPIYQKLIKKGSHLL